MTHATALAFPEENLVGWERALYAFLVEKERRSGSLRTVEGYSRMLQDFFGRVAKAPDKVTAQEVFVWAHGRGLSGKDPSPVTIGARMACLSSFFRFLIRMDIVQRQSLRQAGAAADLDSSGPGTLGRRGSSAAGRHPRHPSGPAGPRHHPHPGAHRSPAGGGLPHDRRRPQLRERRLLLCVPGQRWENRTPGAATSGAWTRYRAALAAYGRGSGAHVPP